jgi:MFS family permease
MSQPPPPPSDDQNPFQAPGERPVDPPGVYRCGSLTYTKATLAVLFFWLLWGDFCYVLMESVTGPIMQLKFKELHASNAEVGLLLNSIPMTLGAFLNPVISFKSDRYRSKWGRRIPFILASLPLLATALILLGLGDHIGVWVQSLIAGGSQERTTLWTFAVLLIIFTFFNTFLNSVYWYLFNDVVPEHLLARFMSMFRICSMGAGALYYQFVFPYMTDDKQVLISSHVTEIFWGAAALYGVGFLAMCLNVKEGLYPPPPPYVAGGKGPIAAVATFATECHRLPHYWYLWACTFIGSIGGGVGAYTLYYQQSLGLDKDQIANLNTAGLITGGLLVVVSGWLADRYHPIRLVLIAGILNLLIALPLACIWLFWLPDGHTVYLISMAIAICIAAPIGALNGVWDPPLLMRLFPRSRYGQFCATNNLWRTMGGVLGAPIGGLFIDSMTRWLHDEHRAYFFIPVWQIAFSIPSLILLALVYRSWKRYGGDDLYVPPIDEPEPTPAQLQAARAGTPLPSRRFHAK